MWVEDTWFYGGIDATVHARNLQTNPQLSMHIGDGLTAIIIKGDARFETVPLERAESYNNVFHVHPYGTDVRQVTHYGSGTWFYARRPAWSPDEGRRIVFDLANSDDGNLGIAMIGSRGLGNSVLIWVVETHSSARPCP